MAKMVSPDFDFLLLACTEFVNERGCQDDRRYVVYHSDYDSLAHEQDSFSAPAMNIDSLLSKLDAFNLVRQSNFGYLIYKPDQDQYSDLENELEEENFNKGNGEASTYQIECPLKLTNQRITSTDCGTSTIEICSGRVRQYYENWRKPTAEAGHISDTYFDRQWNLSATGAVPLFKGASSIGGDTAVAVIDTGVFAHDEFQKTSIEHRNYSDSQDIKKRHGTMVMSVLASEPNDRGLAGLAWKSKFYSMKVDNSDGTVYLGDIAYAVEDAINNNVEVVNISLNLDRHDNEKLNVIDALKRSVTLAATRKMLVFISSGTKLSFDPYENCGTSGWFPYCYIKDLSTVQRNQVFVVGAFDMSGGNVNSESGYGLDFWAPRHCLPAATFCEDSNNVRRSSYYFLFGSSSAATAISSGVAANLLSREKSESPNTASPTVKIANMLRRWQSSSFGLSSLCVDKYAGEDDLCSPDKQK